MTGPGVARASAHEPEALRRALDLVLREMLRLRAELADRDEKIATLRAMVERAHT